MVIVLALPSLIKLVADVSFVPKSLTLIILHDRQNYISPFNPPGGPPSILVGRDLRSDTAGAMADD
jgi:hypothetical protein